MTIIPTLFKEVFLLKTEVHIDVRGSFSEHFSAKVFEKAFGHKINFCQDNITHSKKGVLRGLHYQLSPYGQSKLVSVIQGSVLDVVVDIRKGSPTFGQHFSCQLSVENELQLFIPSGFAHGFITLTESSIFMYKVDQYYNVASEGSISPDDPELGIDWQLPQSEWIQSEKDKKHPTLAETLLFDNDTDLYA
ncbi:dTDP-4-dehydrorhamnose 3,5-epimerase [Flavobacteriaceae bacterium]|nr:dTDP-4-dehydrorhamnose 3,5-epimerase [Flavobacteriaceae bacterium]